MTVVAVSQPMYFPWPGFMEMMKLADVFVWLDDVQFSKGSFTNRIQVKIASGRKWMTVPLDGKGAFQDIRALKTPHDSWKGAHRSLLRNALKGQPHLNAALAVFDRAVEAGTVCDVLIASAEEQAHALEALPPVRKRTSAMRIGGGSWRRLIDLVREVGGTHYISGAGGAGYIDHAAFEREGLQVSYMNYNPAPWAQGHGEFTPYVTSLDLIAAAGEEAGEHLRPNLTPWRERLAGNGAAE